MATKFSMLQLMNAALTAQGLDEVSVNDGSNEFNVLSRNWPLIVESELEDGNYFFTRKQAFLQTRSEGSFGYDDAYLTPSAAIHIRELWTQDTGGERVFIDWRQDGSKVHVDETDGVYVEYIDVAGADIWTANFSRGVQLKLEAVILRALKEEYSDARAMEELAEVHFQRARTSSSKSRSPTDPYTEGRVAAARFGRGSRHG